MNIEKPRKKYNQIAFARQALRRASLRWPPRSEALTLARVDRGKYKCYICKEIFRRTQIHLDHINPVVDTKIGFTTWDEYINRLLCEASGFGVCCTSCHLAKTMVEDNMRVEYKKLNKKGKKSNDEMV